jgi:hypothetical protein
MPRWHSLRLATLVWLRPRVNTLSAPAENEIVALEEQAYPIPSPHWGKERRLRVATSNQDDPPNLRRRRS